MNTIKTILYMGIMHGLFTFFVPYQLAVFDTTFIDFGLFRYIAVPLWIIGIYTIIWCSIEFINRGRGTPAHLDPPKTLVTHGLYKYVRNPIYVGALLVQIGYIFWFGSRIVTLYFLLFFLAFYVLVVFIEEPILKNTFGKSYDEYMKRVPRWIPRVNKVS